MSSPGNKFLMMSEIFFEGSLIIKNYLLTLKFQIMKNIQKLKIFEEEKFVEFLKYFLKI